MSETDHHGNPRPNEHGTEHKWGNWIWCSNTTECAKLVGWVDIYYDGPPNQHLELFCSDQCYIAWCERQKIHCTPRLGLGIALDLLEEENPDLEKVKAWIEGEMPFSQRFDRRKKREAPQCICAEYDGKGFSTCGILCPVHPPKELI